MKFPILKYLTPIWFSLAIALPQWAQAQGSGDLSQKVSQLEAATAQNNRELARAINTMTQIQQDFQSIKGQVQASKYLTQESDRVYKDLDLRVSTLEDKIDQIHQLMKEMVQVKQTGGKSAAVSDGETEDFQTLLTMVNARDYTSAASGFLGFIRKYPKSSLVPKAQFWVGESYYFLGDYARSIKAFQKLVDNHPQDSRVAQAIYRQGLAFSRLKKYPEAKLFYQKVMSAYPNSAEAAKAQTRLHQIEEMEKNQVALGDSSKKSESPPKERPEVSADRPVYKLSPYGKPAPEAPKSPDADGAPSEGTPSPSSPEEPDSDTQPTTPSENNSAPLF